MRDLQKPPSEKNSNWRYEYQRPTAEELKALFDELERASGITIGGFCRLFGLRGTTVEKWLKAKNDTPVWVVVVISILMTVHQSRPVARRAAGKIIVRDRHRPELGEFPYIHNDRGDREEDS